MSDKNKIIYFCLIGFIFVSILGTLSHFFYDWSNKSEVIGILFPANESTWEHLKLAIFPTIIFFISGYFVIKNSNYLFSFFITLLLPMILIPLIFYVYTIFTKNSILLIDILSYYASIAAAFFCCYKILTFKPLNNKFTTIASLGIVIILICYLTFTLHPPKTFLFKDPLTDNYGLCFYNIIQVLNL